MIMDNYDDYFGGMTEEQYQKETKRHFEFLEHLSKVDDERAFELLKRYEEGLFDGNYLSYEEAEMLYHTILWWKDMCDAYNYEAETN